MIQSRRIVVTLLPGDRIAMRLERDRRHNAYVADIKEVFRIMAEWTARVQMLERKARRRRQG